MPHVAFNQEAGSQESLRKWAREIEPAAREIEGEESAWRVAGSDGNALCLRCAQFATSACIEHLLWHYSSDDPWWSVAFPMCVGALGRMITERWHLAQKF